MMMQISGLVYLFRFYSSTTQLHCGGGVAVCAAAATCDLVGVALRRLELLRKAQTHAIGLLLTARLYMLQVQIMRFIKNHVHANCPGVRLT